MNALLNPFTRFFRWWFAELAALLPSPLRRLVMQQESRLVVCPQDGKARFQSLRGGKLSMLGACDLDAAQLPPALAKQIGKTRLDKNATTLALPRPWVTVREGELPLAASENLMEVAGFEMDRLTPFQKDDVYFHAGVIEENSEQQKLRVSLTAAPRAAVDPLLERLDAWKLPVRRIDVLTEHDDGPQGINLLPEVSKGVSVVIGRVVTAGLLLACCALAALAISVPLERKAQYAEALDQEVLLARKKIAVVRNLSDEIEALETNSSYVASLRRDAVPMSRILNDMTQLLPDDTWLSQLRLVQGRLEISGYSADAAKLIEVFDDSLLFSEPKFRSPVTRDQRIGVERFSLTLKVVEEAS